MPPSFPEDGRGADEGQRHQRRALEKGTTSKKTAGKTAWSARSSGKQTGLYRHPSRQKSKAGTDPPLRGQCEGAWYGEEAEAGCVTDGRAAVTCSDVGKAQAMSPDKLGPSPGLWEIR